MKKAFRRAVPFTVVAAALVVGACASSSDVDALRGDVQRLSEEMRATKAESIKAQEMALQASNNAAASAAEARNAAAAANAAAERSERMFQKSLRK
jgi:hypothetical protein